MHMMSSDRLFAIAAYRKREKRIKILKNVLFAIFLYAVAVIFQLLLFFVH